MKKLAILLIVLFSAAAFAQDLPRIAVYVTGNVGDDEKKALGTRMLSRLVNSGRYTGIERSNSFLAEIEKEQSKQRSGAIDDNQISQLGRQFGVKFVCIADITPVLGEFQVSARIVDVETAVVVFIGEAFSPMKTTHDLAIVSDEVIESMFGGGTRTARKSITESTPEDGVFGSNMTDRQRKMMNAQNAKRDNADVEMDSTSADKTNAEKTAAKVKNAMIRNIILGTIGLAAYILILMLPAII